MSSHPITYSPYPIQMSVMVQTYGQYFVFVNRSIIGVNVWHERSSLHPGMLLAGQEWDCHAQALSGQG